MVPAERNSARAVTRKPITAHTSVFIARVRSTFSDCIRFLFFRLVTWAGPATAQVLRARHAASNPLALPARAPAHQHKPRRSVRGGARRGGCLPPEGSAPTWPNPGLQARRRSFFPPAPEWEGWRRRL